LPFFPGLIKKTKTIAATYEKNAEMGQSVKMVQNNILDA
jgi:hypothetical protein